MKPIKSAIFFISLTFSIAWLVSCETTKVYKTGVQDGYRGFVPIKTIVFSCQRWPQYAPLKDMIVSNLGAPQFQEACDTYNEFILAGFSKQPYMKGFSPAALENYLESQNQIQLLDQWRQVFIKTEQDVKLPSDPISYYHEKLRTNDAWKLWLNTLSKNTKYTDSVLFPFIISLAEKKYNERGLQKAERFMTVALILVDSQKGDLIWGRYATESTFHSELSKTSVLETLSYPEWNNVYEKVFNHRLWEGYPGKIAY